MQRSFKKPSLILAAGLCSALSMPAAQACADSPYLSAVCLMALAGAQRGGFDSYLPADGRLLQVGQNAALYSLLGITYGGSANANFNLPDLRGRVVIGAGQAPGLPYYQMGEKGGAVAVTLTQNQLPTHAHFLTTGSGGGITVTASAGTLGASTTMTGLKAITTIENVSANTTLSNLTLKAYSGNGGSSSASGAALAPANGPASKIYATSAPDVSMASGSVTGSAATTLCGTPTTTISGNPTTTITGAPTVNFGGSTNYVGASQPFLILPPYLAMTYFIATQGLYPTPY